MAAWKSRVPIASCVRHFKIPCWGLVPMICQSVSLPISNASHLSDVKYLRAYTYIHICISVVIAASGFNNSFVQLSTCDDGSCCTVSRLLTNWQRGGLLNGMVQPDPASSTFTWRSEVLWALDALAFLGPRVICFILLHSAAFPENTPINFNEHVRNSTGG